MYFATTAETAQMLRSFFDQKPCYLIIDEEYIKPASLPILSSSPQLEDVLTIGDRVVDHNSPGWEDLGDDRIQVRSMKRFLVWPQDLGIPAVVWARTWWPTKGGDIHQHYTVDEGRCNPVPVRFGPPVEFIEEGIQQFSFGDISRYCFYGDFWSSSPLPGVPVMHHPIYKFYDELWAHLKLFMATSVQGKKCLIGKQAKELILKGLGRL